MTTMADSFTPSSSSPSSSARNHLLPNSEEQKEQRKKKVWNSFVVKFFHFLLFICIGIGVPTIVTGVRTRNDLDALNDARKRLDEVLEEQTKVLEDYRDQYTKHIHMCEVSNPPSLFYSVFSHSKCLKAFEFKPKP